MNSSSWLRTEVVVVVPEGYRFAVALSATLVSLGKYYRGCAGVHGKCSVIPGLIFFAAFISALL